MKTANIPAEIVRAKVLESFGRRIAAVRIMVMCVSIVASAILWPFGRLPALFQLTSVSPEGEARAAKRAFLV